VLIIIHTVVKINMDTDRDLPPLLEGESSLSHPSFHESSTNVSVADSAAATLGSDTCRDLSDRGQISSNSATDSDSNDDADSFVGSTTNDNKIVSNTGDFNDSDMSVDEDWVEEPSDIVENIKCLFCSENRTTVHALLEHCKTAHQFDLSSLQKKHGMDQYSFIRLVNFIRSCNPSSQEVKEYDTPLWDHDKFMKPVIEDDPLLMYDFDGETRLSGNASSSEDAMDVVEAQSKKKSTAKHPSEIHVANAEYGHVTLTQSHFDDLHAALQRMQLVVDDSNAALTTCKKDMESMKKTMRHIVIGDKDSKEEDKAIKSSFEEDDETDGYFSGYAHFGIHHDMISDKPRTESYRDAIIQNAALIKDKIVLDLGCGTGILSMFAAQAGAAKVIGVDQSQIIFNAMAIVRENNMENKIRLVRGKIEEVSLGEPVVDVLVSEWMGYFLLFEGMLDSVIHARNKYLAPDGIMLPNGCTISMMALGDSERYAELIGFWDQVYGLKMSSMIPEVLREASIETVPAVKILSDPSLVLHLDLKTCHVQETEFFTAFKLTMTRTDMLTALVGSFDVTFHLDHTVVLPTSPYDPPTHWKQTVFYLPQPISVQKGQVLVCSIEVRRHAKSARGLQVTLIIDGEKLKYTLS